MYTCTATQHVKDWLGVDNKGQIDTVSGSVQLKQKIIID